jgi:hypothetical protein
VFIYCPKGIAQPQYELEGLQYLDKGDINRPKVRYCVYILSWGYCIDPRKSKGFTIPESR